LLLDLLDHVSLLVLSGISLGIVGGLLLLSSLSSLLSGDSLLLLLLVIGGNNLLGSGDLLLFGFLGVLLGLILLLNFLLGN